MMTRIACVALALCASLAQAETVVIVSAKSPVGSLSKDQVADLFVGSRSSAAAALVDQAELKEDFYGKATGCNAAQISATWSKLLFTGKGNPPQGSERQWRGEEICGRQPGGNWLYRQSGGGWQCEGGVEPAVTPCLVR